MIFGQKETNIVMFDEVYIFHFNSGSIV
jgi:hypothetical protein